MGRRSTAERRRHPAAGCTKTLPPPGRHPIRKSSLQQLADAITELDVERARKLLAEEQGNSEELANQRARLALVVGDCDAAEAVLTSVASRPDTQSLLALAKNCARATSGAAIVEDEAAGVWLRLQDDRDRVLLPEIVRVVVPAREALEKDLGIVLPRPMRVELVGDLFSLSAMTGLPLEAAETTGTVGVARFGRVMMLSPRAPELGYTWMDTLAHEMTHVALSLGTRDYAPLWLQEGIAKRQETRWRKAERFDDPHAADRTARLALLTGTSVGIDRIGRSIAMLPSAEMAAISYAEVTSFISHFIEHKGTPAFHLMLADLKGIGSKDPDAALRSVTGFGLAYWIAHWQKALEAKAVPDPPQADAEIELPLLQAHGRHLRLAHLLFWQGHFQSAVDHIDEGGDAMVRFWRARALIGAGNPTAAREALGTWDDITRADPGWLALHGRFLQDGHDTAGAEQSFLQALQGNPLLEDVACEGRNRVLGSGDHRLPTEPRRKALCEAARQIRRD